MTENQFCDPETGVCSPAPLGDTNKSEKQDNSNLEIIYVGDPMCSWCWGIAPDLKKLRDHYREEQINFKIVVGGLRPGGGEPWDDKMKAFLKHHWEEVNKRSGQPFGYALFEKEHFNYDTEPPCRAAVVARSFIKEKELEFFSAIKKKFYVDSEDPGNVEFYQSLCEEFNIDFEQFKHRFNSPEYKQATHEEFVLNRNWGVTGYPSVILKKDDQLYAVAQGFASFEDMKGRIEMVRSKTPAEIN